MMIRTDDTALRPAAPRSPAWHLAWLDRIGPFRLLLAMLAFGFAWHVVYLVHNPPFDLTADEAHYWDWSRHLDIAYYSKGPLVAWIIRASCAVFGDVMWAVRLPALVLAVGTSLLTYWLVRYLFGSSRLGLGAVALNHTIPLFVAGSLIMTIDPPFFFCWALTTCLAAVSIFGTKRWPWLALGVAGGIGLLAKYSMPLWYIGLFAFLLFDRPSRRWLRTPWPYLALVVTLLFFAAPIWWNAQHDWVTFRHVGRQTGVTEREGAWYLNPFVMIATQAGIVGPIVAVFVVFAIREAFARSSAADEGARRARFLVFIGGGFFVCCLIASLRTEIEPNWPAPTYFTLMPLVAWWLARRLATVESWRPVRGFFWAQVVIGIVATTLVHQTHLLYPLAAHLGWTPNKVDLAQVIKARGNAEIGQAVSRALAQHPNAFVLARSYQDASQLAFYVDGHPRTFDIGTYLDEHDRTRHSQFDVWPDRNLQSPDLIGRDAIFFGKLDEANIIENAFDRIERLDDIVIVRGGLELRRKKLYVGYGFRGVKPPVDAASY